MTSYRFFKTAATSAQYYFRFPIVDATVFGRSKSIRKPNLVDIRKSIRRHISAASDPTLVKCGMLTHDNYGDEIRIEIEKKMTD